MEIKENPKYSREEQLRLGKDIWENGANMRQAIYPSYFAADYLIKINKKENAMISEPLKFRINNSTEELKKLAKQLDKFYSIGNTSKTRTIEDQIYQMLERIQVPSLVAVTIGEKMQQIIKATPEQTQELFHEPIERTNERMEVFLDNYPAYIVARNKLIEENMPLVYSEMKKSIHARKEKASLLETGILGLIAATDAYNYKFGYKFSNYARRAIHSHIVNYSNENGNIIALPRELKVKLWKMQRLVDKLNGKITDEEISEELGFNLWKVKHLKQFTHYENSLDEPIKQDGGDTYTLLDKIPDENSPDPLKETEKQNQMNKAEEILKFLPYAQRRIVRLVFGFETGSPMSLREAAKIEGCEFQNIDQAIQRAFKKLRTGRGRFLIERLR